MPQLLNTELLRRLEDAWRSRGAEIAGVLAPGLSGAELDRLVGSAGLSLPTEARVWWGWHNGVTVQTPRGWDIGPDIGFFSIPEALENFDWIRSNMEERDFPAGWLPLAEFPRGPLAIDCGDGTADVAVVHRVNWEVGLFPGAPSMGDMVALWIDMIEVDAWTWNPAGYWDEDRSLIPAYASDMHVV